MRRLNQRAPRIAGLLALALGAVAFLALSGVAAAKDHGDGNGHSRHHHHHHRSLQEAGKISSFDATTGKLTIALPDGESVTGMVTEETRIRCQGNGDRRDHGGQGNEPGDDNGGRGNEPGNDNGRQNEPGDDRGGDNSGSGDSNGTSGGPGPSGESGAQGEGTPGEGSCTVASLVPGAIVGAAELRLEGGVATFTEVELGQDS
jgi:hypothetical protein